MEYHYVDCGTLKRLLVKTNKWIFCGGRVHSYAAWEGVRILCIPCKTCADARVVLSFSNTSYIRVFHRCLNVEAVSPLSFLYFFFLLLINKEYKLMVYLIPKSFTYLYPHCPTNENHFASESGTGISEKLLWLFQDMWICPSSKPHAQDKPTSGETVLFFTTWV